MPRLKGPEKAQIRLRVRKELAEYATLRGAYWLEGLLELSMRCAKAVSDLPKADPDDA